jgi:hypothetical protein
MATVIIRPDGYESGTGFDQTGTALIGRINDGGLSTGVTQNNTSANFLVTLGNDSAYSGGTINSIQLSVHAGSSGKGAGPIVEAIIKDTDDNSLQTSELTFSSTTTLTGATYTTSLTPTIVDGLKVSITPNASGCSVYEVFITVDYTAAAVATTPFIGFNSGKYKIVAGKIKI